MSGPNRRKWRRGLLAAFVGSAAGALKVSLALLVLAPETLRVGRALGTTLLTVGVLALLSGAQSAATYLARDPVPEIEETKEEA